jgi:hypothetical protein
MKRKAAISILAVIQALWPMLAAPQEISPSQKAAEVHASGFTPKCLVVGTKEVTVTCAYTAGSSADADSRTNPRIILNRAVISLTPWDGSPMHIDLTFTGETATKVADPRIVYISIDDEKGENHMRRPLPDVDFRKLEPGRSMKFQETLLAPAFSAGHYTVSLWIPSPDPSLKFDPAHNFLVSSEGVPDRATGLNRIAEFATTPKTKSPSSQNKPE